VNQEQLAAQNAQWVTEAVAKDRGLVTKGEFITESVAARSHLAAALKKIQADLDSRRYSLTDRKLSDEDKKQILGGARLLLPKRPVNFVQLVKEASLDDFAALADEWDQFFSEMK
jgi:hypothetical protein